MYLCFCYNLHHLGLGALQEAVQPMAGSTILNLLLEFVLITWANRMVTLASLAHSTEHFISTDGSFSNII